jgi:hypothetical protein
MDSVQIPLARTANIWAGGRAGGHSQKMFAYLIVG